MKPFFKRVLVTGATGFIGSSLCEELLLNGYEVIALCFGDKERIEHLKKEKGFVLEDVDITDAKAIERVFAKHHPKGVFHTAAKLPNGAEEEPSLFFDVNVRGTLNVLEACSKYEVKNVVYSSSMSVYGREMKYLPVDEKHPTSPSNFYGLSKLQGEELCIWYAQNRNINAVILRYAGVYGSKRRNGAVYTFFQQALKNRPIEVLGDTAWDIVYVQDVVTANILALEKINNLKGEIINIGSGKKVSVKKLAQTIVKLTGSQSEIQLKDSSGPSLSFFFDIRKAKQKLNFIPRSLEDGLQEYFKEIKSVQ